MPPVSILIIYYVIKNKFNFSIIKNLILSLFIFLLIISPTYKSTILYLHKEIIVGLFNDPDYWGYYGAFILGKDNPIRDSNVIFYIKELWANKNLIYESIKRNNKLKY